MARLVEDVLVLLILAVAYGVWCWWFPHTYCRKCVGRKGQGRGSTKYGWSRCRRCRETPGERVRILARVISKATGVPVRGSK